MSLVFCFGPDLGLDLELDQAEQQAGAELCQAQVKLGLGENKMEVVFHL